MSIIAHRVEKLEYGGEDFNLFNDEELIAFLDEEEDFYSNLNADGVGFIELPVETIKRVLKEVETLDPSTKKALKEDLAWAEKKEKEYILYDCF